MRRRFIAMIMVLCFVFSLFTVTANAASNKKKTKYIKVKKATYQSYKKAYNENKKLKKKIKSLETRVATKQMAYEDAMDQYELALENAEQLQTELDSANSSNRWVWSNLKSIGITYSGKNWKIPKEMPEKFIIDGVTYTVTKEE